MAKQKLKSVRLHVLVPHKRHEQIKELSEREGYSHSEIMRRALDEYFKEKPGGNV